MKKYYVYIWFLVDTNEVFYVGKGSGNRVTSMKDRNRHFRNIRRKCKCDYKIVEYFDNEDEAYDFELKLGMEYKSKGQAWCCYVLGKTDKFLSYETKMKISKTLKGNIPWNKGCKMPLEQRIKLSKIKKGLSQSEETKKRRSLSLIGHKVSKDTRTKISASRIGEKNPMFGKKQSEDTIKKRVAKIVGHEVSEDTRKKIGVSNGKRVAMIDPNTNKIFKVYDSASEAARHNCLNHSKISRVCRGKRKTTGGFMWKYVVLLLVFYVFIRVNRG
ncbi:NUMOD3 domain-containing DNA-binding protein [Bacteroides fragilis]|uniref:NUMOD3 domain-containing DNA-binding protein n=1 Tax=Bacteroides fragilis TaxID=817 RepID=UPI00202E2343|nr:hypothetical protein [Bacteroides fragilis]MCM0265965.1 hypothetical protein [Bacteroides fragilis]